MAANHKLKIGVDCGGVCRSLNNNVDVFSVPNSYKMLKELSKTHELYLVSFAGAKRASETRKEIEDKYPGLFTKLFFVKDRKYKDEICRYIGADVLVDDRIDILEGITFDIHKIHFTGDPAYKHGQTPSNSALFAGTNWKTTFNILNTLTPKSHVPDETVQLYKYCYFK